ncbi:MAG: hypothetical protein ACOVQR_08705, partial [Flavobacterium sp.]
MKRKLLCTIKHLSYIMIGCLFSVSSEAQNIFSGEPVQVVGTFNGFSTTPYNSDYRTTSYRRLSVTTGNPTDGRGQWATTINVQNSGGNVTPINMPGGGPGGFLFITGPSSNRFQNKWAFNGVGQGAINGINAGLVYNTGADMGLNMSTTGHYTFVFNDVGYTATNARYYVGLTQNAPVNVTRTGQSFVAGQPVINISTSSTPSTGENVYVRFRVSTNSFDAASSTTIVQATGSGTNWTATLPTQSCGTTVHYYVFTSTRNLSALNSGDEIDRSLSSLRYDDNNGNNYSISFTPASTAAVISGTNSICANSNTNLQVTITGGLAPYTVVYSNGSSNFTVNNYQSGNTISVSPSSTTNYTLVSVTSANGCLGSGLSGSATVTVNPNVTYYADNDGDGFGDPTNTVTNCTGQPVGFVTNNADCNDSITYYTDNDEDGFGVLPKLACGTVTNNTDCNDSITYYTDSDGDSFGALPKLACGTVTDNTDCNDNQVLYADVDGDGFGSTTQVACSGVNNNLDCNDNQIQYFDGDNDGYGTTVQVACGAILTGDCNDNNPAINPGATEIC